EVCAMPRRERVDRAVLRAGTATVVRRTSAGDVPAVVGLRIAADLETDIAARNVIEARAIEAADFHILDGLGLHREISGLRAAYCSQRGGGAKKHALCNWHERPPACVLNVCG